MSELKPVAYERSILDLLQYLGNAMPLLEAHGLDETVRNLVLLRASQTNGCAWCLDMHLKEARAAGETAERLDRIVVWQHSGHFDQREKAALAWTDALTVLDPKTDYGILRAKLREHFSEEQIGALTVAVGMINMWNRINVSKH
ncbi:carboxymuconolactone decarboxylase family protein [Microbaculum marinum]|uniref:Carboxymuconolactone decarboxylase family protein n=1 Tax=Microbaculum marinum TaxID=1764581 RepID=A0AAW9RVZ3_9HYPH